MVLLNLEEILKTTESRLHRNILNSNCRQDLVSLASVSKTFLNSVKVHVANAMSDVSFGVSPIPIPCDPYLAAHGSGREAASGAAKPTDHSLVYHIGGPVPSSFRYLNEAIFPSGIPETSWLDPLDGCDCRVGECGKLWTGCGGVDNCDSEDSSCSCVRLNAAVQSGPAPLFECHSGCSCGIECPLRPTQPGGHRTAPPIRLRYMGRKGWGAYSPEPIEGGKYVADYTGEVLPVEEAKRRMPAYDRAGVNYVLTTQEFFQGGEQVWQTVMDATTSGNVSRFFNHSCEPTLSVFVVRRGSLTPRLAFFTRLHIPAGCELTYDYGAAGAAGGRTEERASHEDDDTLQQHVCKAPRLSSVKKGHKSTFTESRSEVLLLVSNDMSSSSLRSAEVDEERISSRRPEAWKSDDDAKGSLSSSRVPVRRPCLCGARRCRGLLPCNRAIL